jgi:uncharacterized protein YndB with AHSA1/START domain
MSPVGLTQDAGWEIGVSRTLPFAPEHVWTTLLSDEGLDAWLAPGARLGVAKGDPYRADDGTTGELRSLRPHDRVRLTFRPAGRTGDTIVQVVVREAASGTSVRLHQERLADADERERMRDHWASAIERLSAVLEG